MCKIRGHVRVGVLLLLLEFVLGAAAAETACTAVHRRSRFDRDATGLVVSTRPATSDVAIPCGPVIVQRDPPTSAILLTRSKRTAGEVPCTALPSRRRGLLVASSLRGGGGGRSKSSKVKKSSMSASVFNLVNNVAGAGILALSAGQAAGTGWIPSMAICALLGALSSHTFCMIGSACELTKQQDFKGLWSVTLGESSTYVVDSMIALLCVACSIIYSGILGDVSTQLLSQFNLPSLSRTGNILVITLVALFPLSLIKNLSALAFTSLLGFAAIIYTVLFIVVRALDGTYKTDVGRFVTDGVLEKLPSFQKSSLWNVDFTSLVLASNLGLAFVAHYNSPNFYRELENTSTKRFRTMVNFSFFVLVVLYIITMASGYSTFGDVCKGNILLNYHPDDTLATLGRLATFFSILFGFPLVVTGARESIVGSLSSLGVVDPSFWVATPRHMALVVSILAVITLVACTVQDVSLVVGLTGAAMGSFIVYMCPAILYTKAVEVTKGKKSSDYQVARWNFAMVPFGLFIGALGVYMTLKEHMTE